MSIFIKGCNAAGNLIVPSSCWYVSNNATINRGVATPEPFKVWISSDFPVLLFRYRILLLLAWKFSKLLQLETSRYFCSAGDQTSISKHFAAEKETLEQKKKKNKKNEKFFFSENLFFWLWKFSDFWQKVTTQKYKKSDMAWFLKKNPVFP